MSRPTKFLTGTGSSAPPTGALRGMNGDAIDPGPPVSPAHVLVAAILCGCSCPECRGSRPTGVIRAATVIQVRG